MEPEVPVTDLPRSSSPGPMSMEEERGVKQTSADESEGDEERTMFGGSAPHSGPPTTRGTFGIIKRRPWKIKDLENAQTDVMNKTIIPVGSTVSGFACGSFAMDSDEIVDLQSRREKRVQEELTIKELKKGERVNVKILPMFIFLLRDGKIPSASTNYINFFLGTVISIHPTPNLEYTVPITNRLRQRDTGLRATADPSLLVQSLLDLSQFSFYSLYLGNSNGRYSCGLRTRSYR